MSSNETDESEIIRRIPRAELPPWLAETLDLIELNTALFPPLEETREVLEHFYPH